MADRIEITDGVYVGPQPDEEELKRLADDEFSTVINLRHFDEEKQPLSPRQEGVRVQELGMDYVSLPISMDDLTPHKVDDFRAKLGLVGKPAFIHCRSGKRAGAFAMMDLAVRQGWSGEQALKKAEEMGFECDAPRLEEFVKSYVDEQQRQQ